MNEEERILRKFYDELIENMVDLPPEFSAVVDKYFWELVHENEPNKEDM